VLLSYFDNLSFGQLLDYSGTHKKVHAVILNTLAFDLRSIPCSALPVLVCSLSLSVCVLRSLCAST